MFHTFVPRSFGACLLAPCAAQSLESKDSHHVHDVAVRSGLAIRQYDNKADLGGFDVGGNLLMMMFLCAIEDRPGNTLEQMDCLQIDNMLKEQNPPLGPSASKNASQNTPIRPEYVLAMLTARPSFLAWQRPPVRLCVPH
eukprot:3789848-Amphidinium_carterae.1